MRALAFVYIVKEVAGAYAQNAPSEKVFVNTWVRSRAEAVEQDLLVAYPVIDICDLANLLGSLRGRLRSASTSLLEIDLIILHTYVHPWLSRREVPEPADRQLQTHRMP